MLREMSGEQFMEWQLYHEREPFDNDREEYLVGSIIHVIANAHRARKQPYRLDDVTPIFGDRPKPKQMGWEQLRELGRKWSEESRKKPIGDKRGR